MLARGVGVPGLLVRARDAELRRGVQRVQLERVLEGVNRLWILLGLRVCRAQEIPGVGVVGIDFSDVLERINGRVGFVRVLRKQAEVVPGMRVFGILLGDFLQDCLGIIDFLQVEQRDGTIQFRNRQLRILLRRPLRTA